MESESRNSKPECEIKGCSNEAVRAERWKSGEWFPYCDEHDSLGLGTDEVVEVARIA